MVRLFEENYPDDRQVKKLELLAERSRAREKGRREREKRKGGLWQWEGRRRSVEGSLKVEMGVVSGDR